MHVCMRVKTKVGFGICGCWQADLGSDADVKEWTLKVMNGRKGSHRLLAALEERETGARGDDIRQVEARCEGA